MYDFDDDQPQPFRVTPGFVGFVALLLLPAVAALVIFLGAWAVSSEVHAAEASATDQPGFNTASPDEVAGWKKTLVGICPVH